MKGHYLLIIVTSGASFERVYWPLEAVDEEPRQALGRWIEAEVEASGRVRKLDSVREEIRGTVEGYKLCRPTSWHREQSIAAGLDFDAGERPTGKKVRRRGR